jgi:hypothetical protein
VFRTVARVQIAISDARPGPQPQDQQQRERRASYPRRARHGAAQQLRVVRAQLLVLGSQLGDVSGGTASAIAPIHRYPRGGVATHHPGRVIRVP